MRKLFSKILTWIFPQLRWFDNPDYDFSKLRSWKGNVHVEKHVKIDPIYNISNTKIGKYTYINSNSQISNTNIGRFCSIGPNFFCGWGIHPTNGISTSPMFYSTRRQNGVSLVQKNKIEERKTINIGNDVFIGANVIVLDGVTIGDGAIIGAGAVVSKDIPPYAIAAGSPIKILRYRFLEDQIAALLRIQWWNWDENKLKDVESMFFDLDVFIVKYDTKNYKI